MIKIPMLHVVPLPLPIYTRSLVSFLTKTSVQTGEGGGGNASFISTRPDGGGEGTQILCGRGEVLLKPPKPLPIFKGYFGRKRYPFIGILLIVHVHFTWQTPENFGKTNPCLWVFL